MKRAFCVLLLASPLGCSGPAPCDVSGTVRLNGKPVRCGAVVFFTDTAHYGGAVGADGTYSVTGVPAGAVRAAVYSPDPVSVEVRDQKPQEAAAVRKAKGWVEIPDRFSDPSRSGLSYTLVPPTCTVDVELTQ